MCGCVSVWESQSKIKEIQIPKQNKIISSWPAGIIRQVFTVRSLSVGVASAGATCGCVGVFECRNM